MSKLKALAQAATDVLAMVHGKSGAWTTVTTTYAELEAMRPRGLLVCPKGHTIMETKGRFICCPAVVFYGRPKTQKGYRQPSRGACQRPLRLLEDFEQAAYTMGGLPALRAVLPKPKGRWAVPEQL